MQKFVARVFIFLYICIIILSLLLCGMTFRFPVKYSNQISTVCQDFNIAPNLLYSLVNVESHFNPQAISHAGAIGLCQIMPSTAQYICIKNNLDYSKFNLYNPNDNLYICALYLTYLFDKFPNHDTAICAYNAGETVVRNWLNNPQYSTDKITLKNIPYAETKNYIKKIKINKKIYKFLYKNNFNN